MTDRLGERLASDTPSERRQKLGSERIRLIAGLLAASIVGSALALGAVHVGVLAIVAVLAFAACSLLAWKIGLPRTSLVPAALCFGLAIYTYLQAVPLPREILGVIAPVNADIWARALRPFHESGPAYVPLSLDPGATLVEGLKWLTYGMVAVTASALARRGHGLLIIAIVFGSAFLVAVATVLHGLFGATRVFGIYEPQFTPGPWHVGPLLNPNNLAGYLNLAAFCGVGLLGSRRNLIPPWLIALAEAVIIGCDLISGSRGGFVVLPAGILVFVLIVKRRRESNGRPKTTKLLLATSITGGLILAALAIQPETWAELYNKNLTKLEMTAWTKPMLAAHGWLGVGRGAFESVFPAYSMVPGHLVYTHIENFPVQWATEWGIPLSASALCALAWILRPWALSVRGSVLSAASWVGLLVVLAQNLVDLGLEVPAISIAVFAVMGALVGRSARNRRSTAGAADRPQARLALAFACLGFIAVVLALRTSSLDVASERRALHVDFNAAKSTESPIHAALRPRLRAAMLRHPAEPYFPLLGAITAFQAGGENPIPWLERTLERSVNNGGAHMVLASVLAARGARSQAFLELKLAVVSDPDLVDSAARTAVLWAGQVRRTDRPETEHTSDHLRLLLEAVPEGATGSRMLTRMADQEPIAALRRPLLLEATRRDPGSSDALERLAREQLRELTEDKGPNDRCSGERRQTCEREIEAAGRKLRGMLPNYSVGERVLADLLVLQERLGDAEQELARRCPMVKDRLSCLSSRTAVAARIAGPEPFATAVRELVGAGCDNDTDCAATALTLGELCAQRGELGQALKHYSRSCHLHPTVACWMRVGHAASGTGSHVEAAQALDRAYKLGGSRDASLWQEIERERAKALGTQL